MKIPHPQVIKISQEKSKNARLEAIRLPIPEIRPSKDRLEQKEKKKKKWKMLIVDLA